MLGSSYRFHGQGGLKYVLRQGDSFSGQYLKLKYSKNHRRTEPRFAVVISKKVHKSAVGRNRMRRRIYEIVREELPHISRSFDVVIVVFSSELLSLPARELHGCLRQQLQGAGLYN